VPVKIRTDLEDALYVSWAIARSQLPVPPDPLTLDGPLVDGQPGGYVTVVLFRHRALHLKPFDWLGIRFAQCNLRIAVRDPDRIPSVWLIHQLVPAWAAPLGRWVAGQPVEAASLRGPDTADDDAVSWQVESGAPLRLTARPGVMAQSPHWREAAVFVRERPRGYVMSGGRLSRLDARIGNGETMPMRVEVECSDWLHAQLPEVDPSIWANPQSAFMVVATRLEVESVPELGSLASRVPATGVPV
jgi:hypothetical protein